MNPFSLTLFFAHGRADGMRTAKVPNWHGHILVVPRTEFLTSLKRKETGYRGVYFLLGENNNKGEMAYIGESDNVGKRIKDHNKNDDMSWWSTAILITSSDDSLNKAHVKYLEAELLKRAKEISKVKLVNKATPSDNSLNDEAELAYMDDFLGYVLTTLPALQIDFLLSQKRNKSSEMESGITEEEILELELVSKKHDLKATARLVNGECIVEKGSTARKKWAGVQGGQLATVKLRSDLLNQGIMKIKGEKAIFMTDYAFSHLSTAARVILGRSATGFQMWKVKGSGQTYKEWEKERADALEKNPNSAQA